MYAVNNVSPHNARVSKNGKISINCRMDPLNHNDDGQFAINIYTLKMPHFTHDLLEFKDINVQHLLHAADDAHNANNTREYLLALC
jgi:hypothetical protein